MKRMKVLFLLLAPVVSLMGCPWGTPMEGTVTGVTISGTRVTGTGSGKEVMVVIGTPLDLDVEVTYGGAPSLSETGASIRPACLLSHGRYLGHNRRDQRQRQDGHVCHHPEDSSLPLPR